MKPGDTISPLMQKLPQAVPGSRASAWMSNPAPAASPLFARSGQAPRVLDEAEVARRLDEALAEARASGEREGWQKAEPEIAAAIGRLGDALGTVQATARAMARPYAAEMVELALIVARELVGAEIRRDPAPLIALVERCLDDVAGESSIIVRLNPADRAVLLAARPELARTTDLRVVEDASLARGGCAVESTRRLVDARLEERLDGVREGLRQLMEEADRAGA
ncbi:MAG TPA: FliH/SctL family protein [Kofleriaceae bacterium]|nr:FliH/SctL family protein [Kofleriaceae bacterium]